MPLQVTGRHMTISGEQKRYIDKKVDRLRRLCSQVDEISVTLTHEKLHHAAECRFRAGRLSVEATVTATEVLEAIDLLVDKVEAQVRKAKTKQSDKKAASREKARNQEIAMIEELTVPGEILEEEVAEA